MIRWYPVSFLMLRMYIAFLVGPDIPVSLNILILVFVVSGSWDKYLACWMTLEFFIIVCLSYFIISGDDEVLYPRFFLYLAT